MKNVDTLFFDAGRPTVGAKETLGPAVFGAVAAASSFSSVALILAFPTVSTSFMVRIICCNLYFNADFPLKF